MKKPLSKDSDAPIQARIIPTKTGEFEVCHLLRFSDGEPIDPSEEDFGVWAWTAYTLEGAEKIAKEIEEGKRPIRPMNEQV